jgi:protein TonB
MGFKLFISIFIAILLHASFAFAYFYSQSKDEGAIDKGKDGIVVGVGITGSFTDSEKTGENENETIEKKKIIEKPKDKPKPESKPKPKPKVESKPKPKDKPKPKIESKPEPKLEPKPETKSQTVPTVEQELVEESKSEPESKVESNSDINMSDKTQLARRATGTGEQVQTGGDPAAQQGYLSIVKTRISRAKKYPRSARKEGVVGTTIVRFVIKLNGKVEDIQLIKSSGDERLDEEAMKMLKKASPFPAIPKDVSLEPLDLTLPIEFKLKTIKNKFY